jgi:hypothetical protein
MSIFILLAIMEKYTVITSILLLNTKINVNYTERSYILYLLDYLVIKETLSRDFRPLVFFIKQLHLGP